MIAFVSGSGASRAIAMATEGALAVPDVGRVLCLTKDSRASALSPVEALRVATGVPHASGTA
jgi:hypothetical protein